MSRVSPSELSRLVVSGPTGSGKTTLSRAMATLPGVATIEEPLPLQLFADFLENPEGHCFRLQAAILLGRAARFLQARREHLTVFDRSPSEDLEIFIALHRRNGYLNDEQVAILSCIANGVNVVVGSPHAHVVLDADNEMLRARVAQRGAPQWILDGLDTQFDLYRSWIGRIEGPILRIDTTQRDVSDIDSLATWILKTLPEAINGAFPEDSTLGLRWQ